MIKTSKYSSTSQHYQSRKQQMKRPRAPIACFRCHHKKVRCDGAHPYCTRCQSTGSSCSYPSSRRSRNTQPHHVDPYIDHLSRLEQHIRQIEADMNDYREMLLSSLATSSFHSTNESDQEEMLRSHLSKTEQEVQESRTILAQLRLRGEQRIARTKRNQTKEAKQQQQQQQQPQRSSNSKKRFSTRTTKFGNSSSSSSSVPTSTDLTTFSATKTASNSGMMTMYSATSPLQQMTPFLPLGSSQVQPTYPIQQQQQQQQHLVSYYPTTSQQGHNDLYYLTVAGNSGPSYYDPLMDYPWTTPTDFATGLQQDDGKRHAIMDNKNDNETAHYSPSTVAAIEEVTRLAQHIQQ
ncbi:uncharacterized protein BX664DRAFT_387879 [Halteromyces radiatus]|uniref:uncharacterized protein n=1 Tax=Halteromyces radiatus TaxID=101107 RepID=UPI002220E610|nr:uncharacterized protein BX664DRAFT_387879 [Halteromyces radiatus]KAI8082726.1 hypothetical protein BX664DRAFT_387879 [Halteromyces radiatus]